MNAACDRSGDQTCLHEVRKKDAAMTPAKAPKSRSPFNGDDKRQRVRGKRPKGSRSDQRRRDYQGVEGGEAAQHRRAFETRVDQEATIVAIPATIIMVTSSQRDFLLTPNTE